MSCQVESGRPLANLHPGHATTQSNTFSLQTAQVRRGEEGEDRPRGLSGKRALQTGNDARADRTGQSHAEEVRCGEPCFDGKLDGNLDGKLDGNEQKGKCR